MKRKIYRCVSVDSVQSAFCDIFRRKNIAEIRKNDENFVETFFAYVSDESKKNRNNLVENLLSMSLSYFCLSFS